ncbi:MAG: cobalamin B12-binding domain-containing protein [Chloroflexi bacterium]|nr:cobalamin B12-binding domain-containing protein [Chloroflexota bacterium]
MTEVNQLKTELMDHLLGEDPESSLVWAKETLGGTLGVTDFFNQVFTPAMADVGEKFGRMEIFLPELMDAADRAQAISDQVVQPMLTASGSDQEIIRGKIVIASVKGDLHDIGKNMVCLMLRVNGFDVIDMGVNVPPRDILEKAKEVGADIIGLSSLMTTSMPYMKECVELRDGFGHKNDFMVIVGGAPITAEYTAEIGADTFGEDAVDAVQKCLALLDGPA